jgi:hypothetical protein
MKKLALSVLVAGIVTVTLVLLAQMPTTGPSIFSIVLLPFYVIGSIVSGNPHAPNEAVVYLSMFISLAFLTYMVLTIFGAFRGDS